MFKLILLATTAYQDAGLPDADTTKAIANVKNLVFLVATLLTLYFLVTAGMKYVTSGGNPEETKKAGQTIIFACVGLFLILTSYTVMTWVFSIGVK